MGMLLTGVFAKDVGLIYGTSTTFFYHILALVMASIFAFFGSYFLYYITDKILHIRVAGHQEEEGLDMSQHSEQASDFGGIRLTLSEQKSDVVLDKAS